MQHHRTIKLTALAIAIALPFFTIAKEKKSFNKSAFNSYNSLPVNRDAAGVTRQQVAESFPGWAVATDKLNGSFTDINGVPVKVNGNTLAEKAIDLMQDKLNKLGVNDREWKKAKEYESPKASFVNYKQVINGHEVVFTSLSFRFTKGGLLARVQMKNYGTPHGNFTPVISVADAQQAAVKDISGVSMTSATIDADWAWFPIPKANGYTLHPAWHFKIKGRAEGSVPLSLTGYVDAITGEVLYRSNEVKETNFDVTVKGMVYPNGTLHPASLQPLPDLWVNTIVDTITTDTAGFCSTSLWALPVNANVPLAGKWATVIDSTTGLTPSFIDAVTGTGTTYTYPTLAPSSSRHVNAYYHVNRVHNFMKGFFPTFVDMDFSLPTNVDLASGTCNAFYDGASINFYAPDAQCYSFAEIGDIIYHEYGHGINDHFYTTFSPGGTMTNGSLHEGYADVWALCITHNPVLGENCFTGYGGFIRRYDLMPVVYPLDLSGIGDPHHNGEIIAGCWWDVGVNLGSVDSMAKLFTDVYYDFPDGPDGTEGAIFQSILFDALMADDNDANLLNGTPHYNQIVAAFAKHGIYLEGDAILTHVEIANQHPGNPINVNASLALSNLSFYHDITLYYRLNSAGAWNPIVLTGSFSSNFTGTIPAQPEGTTVEYYFTVHDALNTANAYFPITCNSNMPSTQTTIPYQFGVGVIDMLSNNFETSATGWGVGGNPGDDAIGGTWHRVVPIPFSSTFFIITAYPGNDHTTGSGKCLVTGAGTGGSGILGNSIAGGTTTVVTPVFDISAFTTPIVEYYRWFSNEQGFGNYKNDPWIVLIRNASNTSWQTVEKTYQADVQWRRRIFPVSAYLPSGTAQIQLKFIASDSVVSNWDNDGQSLTVGGVDDFFIHDKGDNTGVAGINVAKAQINPNPADHTLNIVLQDNSQKGTIGLYDMTGKNVGIMTIETGNANYIMNTQNVAPGFYNLMIQTDKSVQCSKVVIAH